MTAYHHLPATPSSEKGRVHARQVARHRIVQVDNLKAVLVGWSSRATPCL